MMRLLALGILLVTATAHAEVANVYLTQISIMDAPLDNNFGERRRDYPGQVVTQVLKDSNYSQCVTLQDQKVGDSPDRGTITADLTLLTSAPLPESFSIDLAAKLCKDPSSCKLDLQVDSQPIGLDHLLIEVYDTGDVDAILANPIIADLTHGPGNFINFPAPLDSTCATGESQGWLHPFPARHEYLSTIGLTDDTLKKFGFTHPRMDLYYSPTGIVGDHAAIKKQLEKVLEIKGPW